LRRPWAKAFGFQSRRIVPELDERSRGGLHHRRRAADEHVRSLGRGPGNLRQHHAVDPSLKSGPSRWGLMSQRERDLECLIVLGQSCELITVEDVAPSTRRVEKSGRHDVAGLHVRGRERDCPVAQHRHQRDDTGPARDDQERSTEPDGPDEIATDRSAQLEPISGSEHIGEVG